MAARVDRLAADVPREREPSRVGWQGSLDLLRRLAEEGGPEGFADLVLIVGASEHHQHGLLCPLQASRQAGRLRPRRRASL